MELMSDYNKGSNTPFMEPLAMDAEKNKDYLEVVERPLWLKKSKFYLFIVCFFKDIVNRIALILTCLKKKWQEFLPVGIVLISKFLSLWKFSIIMRVFIQL